VKKIKILILLKVTFVIGLSAQTKDASKSVLSASNMEFLKEMTKDVMESSRIYPGQKVSDELEAIIQRAF